MRFRLVVCLLCTLMLAVAASAQVNTAELSGQVLDQSGAAVPGAKVTLKNLATGAQRTADSDSGGYYVLVNLPPGRYELVIEAKGLTKITVPELILTIGQAAEYNPQLK